MNKDKNKCGTVLRSDSYIPPIAVKLRWMGHPKFWWLQVQVQPQIPFGDDNEKGNYNQKGNYNGNSNCNCKNGRVRR